MLGFPGSVYRCLLFRGAWRFTFLSHCGLALTYHAGIFPATATKAFYFFGFLFFLSSQFYGNKNLDTGSIGSGWSCHVSFSFDLGHIRVMREVHMDIIRHKPCVSHW